MHIGVQQVAFIDFTAPGQRAFCHDLKGLVRISSRQRGLTESCSATIRTYSHQDRPSGEFPSHAPAPPDGGTAMSSCRTFLSESTHSRGTNSRSCRQESREREFRGYSTWSPDCANSRGVNDAMTLFRDRTHVRLIVLKQIVRWD